MDSERDAIETMAAIGGSFDEGSGLVLGASRGRREPRQAECRVCGPD